jgi:hypothetical protein
MRAREQVRALPALVGILLLLPPAATCLAAVQVLVPSGVGRLADNVPTFADPALLWATLPDCEGVGPSLQGGGAPGDEVLPFQLNRASTAVGTPRTLYDFNPTRPVAVCNPYRLLSNLVAFGGDLYFVDNQGPNGHAALWKRSRDSSVYDGSQMLLDMGQDTISADLIVFGVSLIMIRRSDNPIVVPNNIVQYHKDTGALLNGNIDSGGTGSLSGLRYDGRYLYWLKDGFLRRNDTTNGELVDALPGRRVDQYVVYGYEEQCGPKGCEFYSRILYSRGNQLFEAETLNNQVFPLYTSSDPTSEIVAVERGSTDYFFIELRPRGGGFEQDTYRFYRLGVGSTVPALIYGPITDNPLGYEGLRTDFTWLYFRDIARNRLLRLPTDEVPITIQDLRATGIEVTQGLQNQAGSLRQIANKRTVVRFYARSGNGTDVPGVEAALFGSNDFGFLGRLEPVNAGGRLLTVRANPTRTTLDHSFQFELPLWWTTGGRLSLTAIVNPNERLIEDVQTDNGVSTELDFLPTERLLVIYYNWSYNLGGALRSPSAGDVASSRNRMRRLYPIGEPGDAFESPGLHTVVLDITDDGLTAQVDRTNADCIKRYPANADPMKDKTADRNMCASDYVHGRMRTLRQGSSIAPGAVSYGNIAQAPAPMGLNYFTRGYANGQFASGPSTDANYASHEVGHVLQRPHPLHGALSCGHSPDDADYPYNGARIDTLPSDAETRYQGLNFTDTNIRTLTLLDAATTYDVMSYCSPGWISDYTTDAMYQYLASPTRPRLQQRAAPRAVAGDWLIATGTLEPADQLGGFTVVQRTSSVMDPTAPVAGGFTLQMRNGAGGVLANHPFSATPTADQPGKLFFALTVPFIPGTAELRALEDSTQRVLATRVVSGAVPLVGDVQLVGAPSPVDGVVTVTWSASDSDGDTLSFDVFASRDGGASYRPIHLGIAAASVGLDTTRLGGGENRLRVVASDGVHTAYAESAPFIVADRTPNVQIVSPADGLHVDSGQLVTLQVEVSDLQDADIPDDEIYWLDDRIGGVFATGRTVQIDSLPVGEHVIEVQAINSLNGRAADSITLVVGDTLDAAGPTLSVAPQSIGWHVGATDAAPQTHTIAIDNAGKGTLVFGVASDAPWLLIDSQMAISDVAAPQSFTVVATPELLPAGVTSRATLTFTNRDDPDDVVAVPVELSRGNVFDRTGAPTGGACAGDCDASGDVVISELIRGVNIALGSLAVSECAALDGDGDGEVGINELISAVLAALDGC